MHKPDIELSPFRVARSAVRVAKSRLEVPSRASPICTCRMLAGDLRTCQPLESRAGQLSSTRQLILIKRDLAVVVVSCKRPLEMLWPKDQCHWSLAQQTGTAWSARTVKGQGPVGTGQFLAECIVDLAAVTVQSPSQPELTSRLEQ